MDSGGALEHRKIGIHVEHPGVVVAEEAETRAGQRGLDMRRAHPFADFAPGAHGLRPAGGRLVRHRNRGCLPESEKSGYHAERNPGAVEGVGDFRRGAGVAVCEPFARRRLRVVHLHGRLEIEYDRRRLAYLVDRQDGIACHIRADVLEHDVAEIALEVFAGLDPLFGAIDEAEVEHFRPGDRRKLPGDKAPVAFEPFLQPGELRPVRLEPRRVESDAHAPNFTLMKQIF